MHHFIYPSKDTWIISGSSQLDGTLLTDANFGQDEILELKKNWFDRSFDSFTRILLHFDLTTVSNSIVNGDINSLPSNIDSTNQYDTRFFLRLYEAEGNQNTSGEYKLESWVISQSWDQGVGKFGDSPKVTNGVSWDNRNFYPNSTAVTWSHSDGNESPGTTHVTSSGTNYTYRASQSFSYNTPDIEMDVTGIVKSWFSQSSDDIGNNGFLLKISGSQETSSQDFVDLKFFSSKTNTIYSPKLEVRWDEHNPCSGSNTGSLNQITMSGLVDNYIYPKGFRKSYKEDEKVKFRFGGRKRYIQKTFSNSVQTVTGSFIPEGSGSYSILDIATGETIVPFSSYTSMSCDAAGPYFNQWLTGFSPDRTYKILVKVKYDDNQEIIYDDDFTFNVER